MEKFTKEEKELLEKNPNIQAVLSNQVLYTKDFKDRAVKEYENGKTANQIFQEAGINTSILSKHSRKERHTYITEPPFEAVKTDDFLHGSLLSVSSRSGCSCS